MSIQSSLRAFGIALGSLDTDSPYDTYHYWRPMMKPPFVVWAETGEAEDFHTDNTKAEVLLKITVDVYTQEEFDELLDKVFDFLKDSGIPFSLSDVDYEDVGNIIHYSYDCELVVSSNGET